MKTSLFAKWSLGLCRKNRVSTNGQSVPFGDVVYGRSLIGLILKYKHQKYLLRSFFVNCGYCIRLCLTRLPPVYAKILYNKRRFNDFIFDLNTAILSVRWEVQHESRFSSHKFKCHIPIAFIQFSFWPQYNFEDREIILGVN